MKYLSKILIIVIFIVFIKVITIQAAQVEIDMAAKVAQTFHLASVSKLELQPTSATGTQPEPNLIILHDDEGREVAYVWQYLEGGYVVTSADDRIEPIIIQSSSGVFPAELPNPIANFIVWDVVARLNAINHAPEENKTVVSTNTDEWQALASGTTPNIEALSSTYGPLILTLWDQDGLFNNKCPLLIPHVPGLRRLTGCVATATSQLLNFWKYPKSISFSSDDEYTDAHDIDFDGDAAKYDFSTFSELETTLESIAYDGSDEEIASLNFAVGVKLKSSYSVNGTSASTAYVDDALLNKFGFGSARSVSKLTLNWSLFEEEAITNLKNGQPLQIAIHKSEGSSPDNHSVLVDGYRESDGFFHINFGWGNHPASSPDIWYNLPSSYNGYNAIHTIVYNISVYYGWPQHGSDQYNRFKTVYGVPYTAPHIKYVRTTRERIQGIVVGEGNWVYTTHNPETINSIYHPRVIAVNRYGTVVNDVEVTQSNRTISKPIQSPNGDVFFGSGDGIFRYCPGVGSITQVYSDPGNFFFGDSTPRVDNDGYMYFSNDTTIVSLTKGGAERWSWTVPSGGVIYTGIPSIDSSRENVYIGYWIDSTDEAVLVCINRSTGVTRYTKTFSSISSADRGIYTPAIASDGTVYVSVRTKIFALTPGSSAFSEKWVEDKLYAKHSPIAVGADDNLYTEYWTQTGSDWYLTLAKLNASNGDVIWEKSRLDVGTYSGFRQPIVSGNGVVLFPVYWDSSPSDTWALYAYSTSGDFLWNDYFSPSIVYDMVVASDETLLMAKNDGTVIAMSAEAIGDARGGGMGFTDNTPPALPGAMTPLTMAEVDTDSVTLSWACSDPDGHSLKYDVFWGKVTDNETGGVVPLVNDTTETSYVLNDLEPGATYVWMVQATDGQALSYSSMQSFTTKSNSNNSTGMNILFMILPITQKARSL